MSEPRKTWLKRFLFLPPLALGAVVLVWMVRGSAPPQQAEPSEVRRPVRVIQLEPTRFVPRALGYGYVQPGAVWEAVAEVAGKIVFRHPTLEKGRILEAGTVILQIDPASYELTVTRIEAEIESARAELAELAAREVNARSSLKIERRALALAEQDLKRKKSLMARGNASQAAVDQSESARLIQHQRAQELENTLNLMPSERRLLDARLALQQAQLGEAKLDLERTSIRLPFDARIADANVELTEFVNLGQALAVADAIDLAEVTAQIAIHQLAPLISTGVELSSITTEQLSQLPARLGLSAEVRLNTGDFTAAWPARFDRLSETIDPQTRTVGLIVAVDDPYRQAIPGRRPPLAKNMYVEVELRGRPLDDRIVVPRVAIHRGPGGDMVVYLADGEDRLAFRPIQVGARQSNFYVVTSGLEGGERLVVSDLIPAIEGMLLATSVDRKLSTRILAEARGEVSIR
jgi:multidrug efflux pump subunit AcrA (membrane-fusion protein)